MIAKSQNELLTPLNGKMVQVHSKNQLPVDTLTPFNGNATLGNTYSKSACGLNVITETILTTTRYSNLEPNTPCIGTGFPASLNVSGLPACHSIDKAYIYSIVSYMAGSSTAPVAIVTNPNNITTNYTSELIGEDKHKCYQTVGEIGTRVFRTDVTSSISGNGNYTFNYTGFIDPAFEVDGITLIIIYKDPSATYNGNFVIDDGCLTTRNAPMSYSMSGLNVCGNTFNGFAMMQMSDIQDNTVTNQAINVPYTAIINGVASQWPRNFWNFDKTNTTFTSGQTSSSFGVTAEYQTECYTLAFTALYWQDNCTNCTQNFTLELDTLSTPSSCSANTGTASVTAISGGVAPYSYAWSAGAQTTSTITGLAPGVYTVTVTDVNNCNKGEQTVTVTNQLISGSNTSVTNVTCSGANNGIASVSPVGNNFPYTYSWSTIPSQSDSIATGLSPGAYTVLVTDNLGCTGTVSVSITEPASTLALNNNVTNATCLGNDGIASVVVSGGTSPYSYTWSNGISDTVASSLSSGSYTIIVSDANACTVQSVVTVAQSNAINTTLSHNNVSCFGAADGSAEVVLSEGVPPLTYSWSNGQTTDSATGLNAGTYTLVITDSNNCVSSNTVTISQPPEIELNVTPDTTICEGSTITLSANATGNAGNFSYSWIPVNGSANFINVSPVVSTSYSVIVTDNNNCTSTKTLQVSVSPNPILNSLSTDVSCNGGNNASATVTVNGNLQYSYSWSTNPTQTNATATSLGVGSYTVDVVDNYSCSSSIEVIITEPAPLSLSLSHTDAGCSGADGSASATPGGGVVPYVYSWSNGSTDFNAINLTPTSFTVLVTDANGCTISQNVSISQTSSISSSIAYADVSCNGGADGSATISSADGVSPFTYSWSNNTTAATNVNLVTGTYTAVITDSNGCISTQTVTISQPSLINVVTSSDTLICVGASTMLNGFASGGTPGYNYSWLPVNLSGTSVSVSPSSNASYTLQVTDANNCSVEKSVNVSLAQPLMLDISPDQEICPGDSVKLTSSAFGGNGVYSYSWTPGAFSADHIFVNPTVNTTYTLVVSDGCGTPPVSNTVLVAVNPLPIVVFSSDTNSGCAPLCVTFEDESVLLSGTVSGWSWSVENKSINNLPSPVNCFNTPGVYDVSLEVTSDKGCVNSITYDDYITVYGYPEADFSVQPETATILDPIFYFSDQSSGSPVSHHWSFDDKNDATAVDIVNPSYTYSDTGSYCVQLIVANEFTCKDTAVKCVKVIPDWTIYVPNTFTPNNDGENDFFAAIGTNIIGFEMWIYDRWGNEIYHCTNINEPWNGIVQHGTSNEVAPIDTYVWVISFTDVFKQPHRQTGHINLIK